MDKRSKSTNKTNTTKAHKGMNRTEFAQEYSIETGKKTDKKTDKNCNKDCDHKKGNC
ncbi:hypothetical protein [Chakrabartyella piscis]|uniref:hypothetical protein n=1 Tax=Chakrabartyella piscis TaxID=2918914 RepID=UPI0029585CC5|nr:hypothetical protein [Chakrabartyella piscis]